MKTPLYAHTAANAPESEWEPLYGPKGYTPAKHKNKMFLYALDLPDILAVDLKKRASKSPAESCFPIAPRIKAKGTI